MKQERSAEMVASAETAAHVRGRERGQILALFALGLLAIIGMVGLIIEGGNIFGQQRIAQNASDSAANAGALVIAENLAGVARTGDQVLAAITTVANANGLQSTSAEYTDGFGTPTGVAVASGAIPSNARGVRVGGDRVAATTFGRVLGINELTASADATAVAGASSGECVVDEDGCALLPVTFPVKVATCDGAGNLASGTWVGAPPPEHAGDDYWPLVDQDDLPSATNPGGNPDTLAILSLCRAPDGSSGAFGWLDLAAGMNLADEIIGPLNRTVDLPDWIQTQPGNPNAVEDELETYIHQPVLIPLHNGACREDPGDDDVCDLDDEGVDPVGNNTWYYIHTLAVFYPHEIHVQGADKDNCASGPGSPVAPVTNGAGFLGCMKGWFVSYVIAGPIVIGNDPIPAGSAMGIQLIR
jgi:Flp pilus assembly protein TadG